MKDFRQPVPDTNHSDFQLLGKGGDNGDSYRLKIINLNNIFPEIQILKPQDIEKSSISFGTYFMHDGELYYVGSILDFDGYYICVLASKGGLFSKDNLTTKFLKASDIEPNKVSLEEAHRIMLRQFMERNREIARVPGLIVESLNTGHNEILGFDKVIFPKLQPINPKLIKLTRRGTEGY